MKLPNRSTWFSVATGLLSLTLMHLHLARVERRASGGEERPVVVLTRDVPAGTALESSMLTQQPIPERYRESRHIPASEVPTLVGLRLGRSGRAQETLQWTDLAGLVAKDRQLSERVPHGMRAMAIDAKGPLGALIRPGDRVDLLCTPTLGTAPPTGSTRTHTVLENLLVLARGRSLGGPDSGNTGRGEGLTVGVRVQDSKRLADARNCGRLQVTLRHPDDLLVSAPSARTAGGADDGS